MKTLDPIVRTVEVPCGQEMAFRVFIAEMDTWWPLGRFTTSAMRGRPAVAIRVDTRPGGAIVEVGADGIETVWGAIEAYEPHDFVSMRFHIPTPTEAVARRSLVEVRFDAVGVERTRVELTQRDWEAFGERAAALQGGYGGGWTVIFEQRYAAACGA